VRKAYLIAAFAAIGVALAGCQSSGSTSASTSLSNPVAVLTAAQQEAVRQELSKEKIAPPNRIISIGAIANGEGRPMLGCVLIRRETGTVRDDQIIMGAFSVIGGKDVFRVGGSSFNERRPGGMASFCRRSGMIAELKNSNVLGVA
jgi:hypothetical protein